MLTREQNYRKTKFLHSQTNPIKYTYLTDQNCRNPTQLDRRTNVLETISEETISEDKGSVSNRSQLPTERQKMHKTLSEKCINQNTHSSQWLPLNEMPIQSTRSPQNTPQDIQSTKKATGFEKKHNNNRQRINNYYDQKISQHPLQLQPISYRKLSCRQCEYYSFKMEQLQSSYGMLLSAKNEQLQQCKIIINCLQQKLITIEKRSQHQLQKNRKIRLQLEKKNIQQAHTREKQNEMMEYLKNREIILMEQIKDLENQMFITKIRLNGTNKKKQTKDKTNNDKYLSKKSLSQSNPINLVNFPSYANMQPLEQEQQQQRLKESHLEHSVSEYSANTCKSQIEENTQRYGKTCQQQTQQIKTEFNSILKQPRSELIQRVPLTQMRIRDNQIQWLKDDLLISQLKTKLQQTKNLQTLYLIR